MSTAKNFIDPASLCSLCRMRLAVGLCAGCRCKRYCSKTCQKLDWIAGKHRLRCEFLKSGGCALDEAAEKETEEEPFEFSEEEDSESEGSDVGMPKRGREKGEKKKQKKKEPSSRRRKTEKESDEPGSLGKNEQKVIDTLLKSAKNPIPVSVSGAVAGEIVYGINENQTDGIEFEVIQGMIHRSKKLCDALGGDAGVAKVRLTNRAFFLTMPSSFPIAGTSRSKHQRRGWLGFRRRSSTMRSPLAPRRNQEKRWMNRPPN